MLLDFEAYRDIYLVFMDTRFLGDNFLKDGFKHVYAIERQALGWLCSDPSKSDLHTHILPAHYEAEVMIEFKRLNPSFTLLHLHVQPRYETIYPRPGLISCVSTMQYMLSIYWPFVFTPYQLYTKLLTKTPPHIEVIACETNPTEHSKKPMPQPVKQTH